MSLLSFVLFSNVLIVNLELLDPFDFAVNIAAAMSS